MFNEGSGSEKGEAEPLLTEEEWVEIVKQLRLSPRQASIVRLMLQGKRDKAIAAEMGVKFSTVRTYLQRMFSRLKVEDRVELILLVFAVYRRQVQGVRKFDDSKDTGLL